MQLLSYLKLWGKVHSAIKKKNISTTSASVKWVVMGKRIHNQTINFYMLKKQQNCCSGHRPLCDVTKAAWHLTETTLWSGMTPELRCWLDLPSSDTVPPSKHDKVPNKTSALAGSWSIFFVGGCKHRAKHDVSWSSMQLIVLKLVRWSSADWGKRHN